MPFKGRNTHSGQAKGSLRKKKNRQRKRQGEVNFLFAAGRALADRIDAIVSLIPDDFAEKTTVRAALLDRKQSIAYTAPEVIGIRWREVTEILGRHLPHPSDHSWAQKIADLFRTAVPA